MPREKYVVTVTRPAGVSITEMRNYIREAVDMWGGQFHPDDPMFYGQAPVTVVRVPNI